MFFMVIFGAESKSNEKNGVAQRRSLTLMKWSQSLWFPVVFMFSSEMLKSDWWLITTKFVVQTVFYTARDVFRVWANKEISIVDIISFADQ